MEKPLGGQDVSGWFRKRMKAAEGWKVPIGNGAYGEEAGIIPITSYVATDICQKQWETTVTHPSWEEEKSLCVRIISLEQAYLQGEQEFMNRRYGPKEN